MFFLIYSLLFLFVLNSSISFCQAENRFPLWFYEPASINSPGSLGFANLHQKGKNFSILLAECRALKGLCEFQNWDCNLNCSSYQSFKNLKKHINKIAKLYNVKFQTFSFFSSFYTNIPIFVAHAYVRPIKTGKFAEEGDICSIEKCKPEYLCNSEIEGYAGVVSYSNVSFTFFDQYKLALKRALELFSYLYQTQVDGNELKKVLHSGFTSFRLHLKEYKVTPLGNLNSLRFIVRALCLKDNGLYLFVISPDLRVKKRKKTEPCWIEDRFCLGKDRHIAVGVAGPNIGGFYFQLKKALVRALVELAKSKGIIINEELVRKQIQNQFTNFKLIFKNTKTHTKEVISARLVGIYKKGKLIFVGVEEVKP
jgi:hypothetical protein